MIAHATVKNYKFIFPKSLEGRTQKIALLSCYKYQHPFFMVVFSNFLSGALNFASFVNLVYSARKLFTGLASDAFTDLYPTVRNAIRKVPAIAVKNMPAPILILYLKSSR